ncbi:M16 family metallopeptidase [Kitasatospora sp. NPDC018058]|uniref:M16 family metallopeptidase n=1 Tax=Kitasatospora sp. NPDC018058 TaxID=3364025 RepID=UPI0037C0557E
MVELRVAVPLPVGSAHEAAVAEVLVASLMHGYPGLDHSGIADRLERSGSTLDVGRTRWLMLAGSCPAGALGDLADLIGSLLAGAGHSEDAVQYERRRAQQKVGLAGAQPQTVAAAALVQHAFGDVPALAPLPSVSDIGRVTAGDVRALHSRVIRPAGAYVVVVGDIDPDAAAVTVARATAGWESGPAVAPPAPPRPLPAGSLRLVDRPGAVQSQIRLLAPGIHRDDPRFPALSMTNVVFGGYFSSRLVMSLREELGLAYRVDSSFRDYLDQVVIAVEADTATEATAAALAQIRDQMRQLVQRPVTGRELDAARHYMAGMSVLVTASQGGLAGSLLSSLVLSRDPMRMVTFPSLLEGLSVDELQQAAAEFYRPEAFCGVVVGDRSALTDDLKGIVDDVVVA